MSAGHVDAIAGAIRNLDDTVTAEFLAKHRDLLADAERMGVDLFERNCRDIARQLNATHAAGSDTDELNKQRQLSNVRRWTDEATGMRHTHIELDPVRDAQLWAAIDQHRRHARAKAGTGLTWEQLQVEALLAAVTSGGDTVVQLHVLIDLATLQNGLHANSICELADGTPLPVSVVRQMACEAEIIPIVLGSDGRRPRHRPRRPAGDRTPTPSVTGDAPHLHPTRLPGPVRRMPDPSHHPLGKRRTDRPVEPGADVRIMQTPPRRPRRRLDPDHDTRPHRHLDPTRRHHLLDRQHHRPRTQRHHTTTTQPTRRLT